MKWAAIILMMVLSAIPVVADLQNYFPGQQINLGLYLANSTGDAAGANCSVQIRNSSYGVILDANLKEIGNGFYNGTYNISSVGTYFCRQNCTQGPQFTSQTCDFTIGVGDMSFGTIIMIPFLISLLLLVFSWMLNEEKYWALKLGLAILAFVPVFWSYNYAVLVVGKFYVFPDLVDSIGRHTFVYGTFFWVLIVIITISVMVDVLKVIKAKRNKTGQYDTK